MKFPIPEMHALSKNIDFIIEDLPKYGNLTLNNMESIEDSFNINDINNIFYNSAANKYKCINDELYFEDRITYYLKDVANSIISSKYYINFTVYIYI